MAARIAAFVIGLILMGLFWLTWPITKLFVWCIWNRSCWP